MVQETGLQYGTDGLLDFSSVRTMGEIAPANTSDTQTLDDFVDMTFILMSVEYKGTEYGDLALMECVDQQGQEWHFRTTGVVANRQLRESDAQLPLRITIRKGDSKKGQYFYFE